MARFTIEVADVGATVRRAWDTSNGQFVVLECGLRPERTRKIQALPPSPAIAPYERTRISNRVHVIHPAPLEFAQPIDEFDVAQAIGSLLDGLAWLHSHGVTHGAIDANALTSGPTGGRLSLAGALSQPAHASADDDVYAAAVLAFTLLVGDSPGPDVDTSLRLAESASPSVAAAIIAGLDPDASRRPAAESFATMVRGEYIPTVAESPRHSSAVARLREVLAIVVASVERGVASITQVARPYATRATAGVGAAFAMVLLAIGLAVADQRGTEAFADANSPAVESTVSELIAARVEAPPASTTIGAVGAFMIEDVIAADEVATRQAAARAASLTTTTTTTTTTTLPPAPPPTRAVVVVAPPTTAGPLPTTLAPKPVVTTVPPTTVAPTTTRAAPTTKAPTTTRVTTTTRAPTTTRATTTTRKGNGKG
ncbi:MAG: hypothetical protein ABI658_27505 [Acidimicrobiales bacterium]